MRLEVLLGDITTLAVDVVVNAANASLLGGGGVDGAIHRAAGPDLLERCRTIGGCAVGDAVTTRGYGLPAPWVVHTVGPVWRGGAQGEAAALASCYRRSLARADQVGARSVAFPAISTGAYGYPTAEAAAVAVRAVRTAPTRVEHVRFVCFDTATSDAYEALLLPDPDPDAGRTVVADLGTVFDAAPDRWGLRGDPRVWTAMQERLRGVAPATPAEARALLHVAFEAVTGAFLDDPGLPDQVFRRELDHGGMSGGHVHITTWRSTLMPLLEGRVAT